MTYWFRIKAPRSFKSPAYVVKSNKYKYIYIFFNIFYENYVEMFGIMVGQHCKILLLNMLFSSKTSFTY